MKCRICNNLYHGYELPADNPTEEYAGLCPRCAGEKPDVLEASTSSTTVLKGVSAATIAAMQSLLTELAENHVESSRSKLVVKELKGMVMGNIKRLDETENKLKKSIEDIFKEERNTQIVALQSALAGLEERTDPLITVTTELEIQEFPEAGDEDLEQIVFVIARYIECALEKSDLVFIKRIGEAEMGIRSILVGFSEESKRTAFWYAAAYKRSIYIKNLPEFKDRLPNVKVLVSERHIPRKDSDDDSDDSDFN